MEEAMDADTAEAKQPSLTEYLSRRNGEYEALRSAWLANDCPYAPSTWPADRCMLTALPAELLLMILPSLYQADLFHLAATCRRMVGPAIDLLYRRDVAHFDCLALRWACTFGIGRTLERALHYRASPNHAFGPDSHQKCDWLPGAPDHGYLYRTPLLTAVSTSQAEIVAWLLAHGANPSAPDPSVAENPRSGIASVHSVLYPINVAMGAPGAAFTSSFRPGDPGIVGQLLRAGADPNQATIPRRRSLHNALHNYQTPLLMAMQGCVPVETVRMLLERGARATTPGSFEGLVGPRHKTPGHFWDRTPLGLILLWSATSDPDAFSLHLDKIRLLLAHGAAHELVYLQQTSGAVQPMPLLSCHWGHIHAVKILELFIAAGADIARWGAMAVSPIISVLWWAERFILRYRSEEEANPKAGAAVSKVCELITMLAEATLVPGQPAGPVRRSTIIDAVVSPKCLDQSGFRVEQTALRYLCSPFPPRDLHSFIPVLLRHGADMNAPDPKGRTALHHSAMFCFRGTRIGELAGFLGGPAPSGLAIDAVDVRGWTPLHFACLLGFWSEPFGQVTAARLLLEHGADVRRQTRSGWSPLSLAVLCANLDLVNLLLDHGAHADDLYRLRPDLIQPTLARIGRVVFVGDREPAWPTTPIAELAAQLGNTRASVAALLEARLGVEVPCPPPPPPPAQPQEARGRAPPGPRMTASHVPFVNHPFGMDWMGGTDYADPEFEDHMDAAFRRIDELGLMAWIMPIRPWEGVRLRWWGVGGGR